MSTILSLSALAFLACSGAEPDTPDPVVLAAEPLVSSSSPSRSSQPSSSEAPSTPRMPRRPQVR